MKFFLFQLFLSIDQFVNVLFGGYADETLSSRAYRMSIKNGARWKICSVVINTIFFDSTHCSDAYFSERIRKQLPPEFRDPLKKSS